MNANPPEIRRDLGSDDAITGTKDIRINPDLVSCDLWDFRDAHATGALDRAVELFRGRFLEGFHLPGAESFEQWVEATRAALAFPALFGHKPPITHARLMRRTD